MTTFIVFFNKTKLNLIVYLFFFGFVNHYIHCQISNKYTDTLKYKTYGELYDLYYQNTKNIEKAEHIAFVYLDKAKKDKDTVKIANSFCFIGDLKEGNEQLRYYDSIINITKNLNHKTYPAYGYFRKGRYFYTQRNFKKSLDFNLKAFNYAKNNNPKLVFRINYTIGLLRSRLGDHQKALQIFKDGYNYAVKNDLKNLRKDDYLRTLFSLSNSFRQNQIIDSATYYCNIGIDESKLSNPDHNNRFILIRGILRYNLKEYKSSKSDLKNAIDFFNESQSSNPNLAFAHFYYGKVLIEENKEDMAIRSFKKVDSIFQILNDIHPELRETYNYLIQYHKKNRNKILQLEYIEKLLQLDSILNNNYKYLNNNIIEKYDTPLLLAEKEELIRELGEDKKVSSFKFVLLVFLILIISASLLYNIKKKKKYRKKFNELISEKPIVNTKSKISSNLLDKMDESSIGGMSKETIDNILVCLETFVENEDFLKKSITVVSLAKQFGTNTKYLSKVINVYKQKKFIDYINDLRIDYTIEKMKKDTKFRKYSIKAIANDVGYKKAESFSKAFQKKTGILPSYFIKEIEKLP